MDAVSNTNYSSTVRLFNQEQDTLWRARAWASLTALFLEGAAVTASKMELHSHIRLGSIVSMIFIPPLVYYLRKVNESETILLEENQVLQPNQLPLTAPDLERKKDKKSLGTTQLICVALAIVIVVGTLFVFRARESIKLAALGLSSLSFAIAYVRCLYIHLNPDTLSLPTRSSPDPSSLLNGRKPIVRKLSFSDLAGQSDAKKSGDLLPEDPLNTSVYHDALNEPDEPTQSKDGGDS